MGTDGLRAMTGMVMGKDGQGQVTGQGLARTKMGWTIGADANSSR